MSRIESFTGLPELGESKSRRYFTIDPLQTSIAAAVTVPVCIGLRAAHIVLQERGRLRAGSMLNNFLLGGRELDSKELYKVERALRCKGKLLSEYAGKVELAREKIEAASTSH